MKKNPAHVGRSLKEVVDELLNNPHFRVAYQRQVLIGKLGRMVRKMRIDAGLTQAELATRMSTKQSVISRLETGKTGRLPCLWRLSQIARACGRKMRLRFVDPEVKIVEDDLTIIVSRFHS